MAKILLQETFNIRLQLNESENGGKMTAKGEYARSDVPTANRRVYPRALWDREINRLSEDMQARKVFGELDHPADGKTKLARVSHLLTNLFIEKDGTVIGESEIIPETDNGRQLLAILRAGGSVGVSSRGYGSVKKDANGNDVVQEDFTLMTFDFVADPANGSSYPTFKTESNEKKGITTEETGNKNPEAQASGSKEPEAVAGSAGQPLVDTGSHLPENGTETKTEEEGKEGAMEKNIEDNANATVKENVETSKLTLSDAAIESLKKVMAPFILPENTSEEMKKKDETIVALTKELDESNQELETFALALKNVSFKLFIEQNLASHPRCKKIQESLDMNKIDTLTELSKILSIHIEDAKNFQTQGKLESRIRSEGTQARIDALTEEVSKLKTTNKALTEQAEDISKANKEKMDKLVEQRDSAIILAEEAASAAYLEKKLRGHANAETVRNTFLKLEDKSKKSVDVLVEQFIPASPKEGVFENVRRKLGSRFPATNLVESCLNDTKVTAKNNSRSTLPGTSFDLDEAKRLAGIK